MNKEFQSTLFTTLRDLTSKYVEHFQTDLAIDVESILMQEDLTQAFWYGRTGGTCLAYNEENCKLYERHFSDIKVVVYIDFINERLEVKELERV